MELDENTLKELAKIYLVANTPAYLYKRLRSREIIFEIAEIKEFDKRNNSIRQMIIRASDQLKPEISALLV